MLGDFSPGLERAAAAGVPVWRAPYPDGKKGVTLSIEKVCTKIMEGRYDPAVGGWAISVCKAKGLDGRTGAKPSQIMQALLDEVRAVTIYKSDALGSEVIQSAAATLCLRPDLCIGGGDCDDLTVALGAAIASFGIPVRVIKQAWTSAGQEHVLVAGQDEAGEWMRLDPSTTLPAGQSVPADSEMHFDPTELLGLAAEIVTLGHAPPEARHVRVYKDGAWWAWTGSKWIATRDPFTLGAPVTHNPTIVRPEGGQPYCGTCARSMSKTVRGADGLMHHPACGYAPGSGPGVGASGSVLPSDILAYRAMWDPWVKAMLSAMQTAAIEYQKAAIGQPSQVDLSIYATPPSSRTLQDYADGWVQDVNLTATEWNAEQNLSDSEVVFQGAQILTYLQRTVLGIYNTYVPQLRHELPGVKIPDIPDGPVQVGVIQHIEGLGILAVGVLEILAVGANGALQGVATTAGKLLDLADKTTTALTSPWLWGTVAVGVAAVATIVFAPEIKAALATRKAAGGRREPRALPNPWPCPTGSRVQSVLFPVGQWDTQSARRWLTGHGMRAPRGERTERFLRFRQLSPGSLQRMRTIRFGSSGILAVVGWPRC